MRVRGIILVLLLTAGSVASAQSAGTFEITGFGRFTRFDDTLRIQEDSAIKYFPGYFRDIPLGDYTLTATLTKADGASYPIRMRKLGGEYENSFAIQFTPWDIIAHVETVTVLATR